MQNTGENDGLLILDIILSRSEFASITSIGIQSETSNAASLTSAMNE